MKCSGVLPVLELRRALTLLGIPPRREHQDREAEQAGLTVGRRLHLRLAGSLTEDGEDLIAHIAARAVVPHAAGAPRAGRQPGGRGVDAGPRLGGEQVARLRVPAADVAPPAVGALEDRVAADFEVATDLRLRQAGCECGPVRLGERDGGVGGEDEVDEHPGTVRRRQVDFGLDRRRTRRCAAARPSMRQSRAARPLPLPAPATPSRGGNRALHPSLTLLGPRDARARDAIRTCCHFLREASAAGDAYCRYAVRPHGGGGQSLPEPPAGDPRRIVPAPHDRHVEHLRCRRFRHPARAHRRHGQEDATRHDRHLLRRRAHRGPALPEDRGSRARIVHQRLPRQALPVPGDAAELHHLPEARRGRRAGTDSVTAPVEGPHPGRRSRSPSTSSSTPTSSRSSTSRSA